MNISSPTLIFWLSTTLLVAALIASRIEIYTLRKRRRRLLTREAELEARGRIAAEQEVLNSKLYEQAFQEGVLEGRLQAERESRNLDDRAWKQGYEHGVLVGERKADEYFHIDYWTEIRKNQGYFFTSADVIAHMQLMYKNIPIGQPQRYVLEKSESVDRESIERAVSRMLGEKPMGEENASSLSSVKKPTLRLVPRKPKALGK